MYVRFIEITSPSNTQFEMAASWFKTEWSVLAVEDVCLYNRQCVEM